MVLERGLPVPLLQRRLVRARVALQQLVRGGVVGRVRVRLQQARPEREQRAQELHLIKAASIVTLARTSHHGSLAVSGAGCARNGGPTGSSICHVGNRTVSARFCGGRARVNITTRTFHYESFTMKGTGFTLTCPRSQKAKGGARRAVEGWTRASEDEGGEAEAEEEGGDDKR